MRKSGTEATFAKAGKVPRRRLPRLGLPAVAAVCCLLACLGCGTMKTQQATEQLLLSRAVDDSIARLDFRILAGKKVFLDTTYVNPVKGAGFVNSDYIISSLRQQLFAAHCLVQENKEDADYVVEARVGALGSDGHEVVYGIPASSQISTAATLVPNTPVIPPIPEIALAKKNDNLAAAKIALFAYHRETRTPVWQSGIETKRSHAKDFWVFGAGPFQSGSIYDKARFAGEELSLPTLAGDNSKEEDKSKEEQYGDSESSRQVVDYFSSNNFGESLAGAQEDSGVRPAGFEGESAGEPAKISVSDNSDAAQSPVGEAADTDKQAAKE